MAVSRQPGSKAGPTRFCALCAASGVVTPSEQYHATQLEYCTFHYWLMRGRGGSHSYSLEDYANASKRFAFMVSLPSRADCEKMQKEDDGKRRRPAMELRT